jgi:DNA-directed RNA polymerase subunit RPC12/RpoP
MGNLAELKCPVCKSEALYRYGHVKSGKQRLKCVLCGRQFVLGFSRNELSNRPTCPQCGLKMHLYMHDKKGLRFRCSDYPVCKSYKIIPFTKEVVQRELLCS